MMKNKNLSVLVAFMGLSLASSAFAADSMIFGGVQAGAGFFNNNGGTNFTLGVDGGYKITPEISVGPYLTWNNEGVSGANVSANLWTLMAQGYYWLKDIGPGMLHVGADVGLGINSVTVNGVSNSSTSFGFGPTVGYDYSVTPNITVGGEANFLIFPSGAQSTTVSPTTGVVTTSSTSVNVLNLLASVKYWF